MKPCCKELANRREGAGPRNDAEIATARDDLTVSYCIVCECRHFEVEVEAGLLGVKGQAL